MYSLDLNTNVAVERQAERMSAVRRVGLAQVASPAAQAWAAEDAPLPRHPARVLKAGLVLAVLAVGMLLAVAAMNGGAWLGM
jgi:hypothetical protein